MNSFHRRAATLVLGLLPTAIIAATLTWVAPTNNTDGSALTNLASFSIHWGSAPGALTNIQLVSSPAARSATVNTGPGTWYYGMRALNSAGTQSGLSNIASLTTSAPLTTPNPPSAVATAGREVFYVIQQSDRLVFLPVGTISATAPCDVTQPVGPYFVVPRAGVTWYGPTKPLVVVTQCN